MKKILITIGILFVFGIASYSLINKPLEVNTVNREEKEQKPSINEETTTTVKQAIKDYEKMTKEEIKLPKNFERKLPFKITRSYGEIENGGKGPILEISFLNEEKVFQKLGIRISQANKRLKKIDFDDVHEESVELKGGTIAYYLKDPHSHGLYSLRFQKEKLNYEFQMILNMQKDNMKKEFIKLFGGNWE